MSYRTILVHLDSSARGNDRVAFAVRWAKAHQAHLVGLVSSGLYDGLVIPAEAFSSGPSVTPPAAKMMFRPGARSSVL